MEERIPESAEAVSLLPEYKKTAYKVGVFAAVIVFLRVPASLSLSLLYLLGGERLSPDALYLLHLTISFLFLQFLPAVIGAGMFGFFGERKKELRALYRVPKKCARAVGNFPAVYGLGQLLNLLTIVVTYFATKDSDLTESMNPITQMLAPNMGTAWAFFIFAAIIAPIFEEFVFRGVLLRTLKPYGNGLAIFFTGIFFGVFHGNLSQCFYAAAIGIALGYIADVTDSLIPTTVIHILVNSVSSGIALLMTTPSIQDYLLSGAAEGEIPDGDMLMIVVFAVYTISALLLGLAGIVHLFIKLKQIRRYRVPKVWDEVGNGKKVKMLLLTVPMAIAVLLMIDTYTGTLENLLNTLIFS
ncbi:MAG: CPBP family intramembrane metalloprotease [Ruminiclostridium sp.]|nr:CPBP family intramembrane metalloprotease [Ruminiclostridium sp.]